MALAIKKPGQPYYSAKAKPRKKPDYLRWLHELPCVVTGRYGVQAAHISFAAPEYGHWGRGKGTKAPDLFALPLCPEQHELQHSGKLGSEKEFWQHVGINPHHLCVVLWAIYSAYDEPESIARATAVINQKIAALGRLKDRVSREVLDEVLNV